jgi:hypothetical protein
MEEIHKIACHFAHQLSLLIFVCSGSRLLDRSIATLSPILTHTHIIFKSQGAFLLTKRELNSSVFQFRASHLPYQIDPKIYKENNSNLYTQTI